jgi:hypothetical protein
MKIAAAHVPVSLELAVIATRDNIKPGKSNTTATIYRKAA